MMTKHASSSASCSTHCSTPHRRTVGSHSALIALPKTQRAQCLLTQAPSEVDEKQLRELYIRLRATEPAIKA